MSSKVLVSKSPLIFGRFEWDIEIPPLIQNEHYVSFPLQVNLDTQQDLAPLFLTIASRGQQAYQKDQPAFHRHHLYEVSTNHRLRSE